MDNELIKITTNDEGKHLVSARELHEGLKIRSNFTTWFNRMLEYGFSENTDYLCSRIGNLENTGFDGKGTPKVDYIITLDMAKEICMIQRTPEGKSYRNYFIQCEKQLKEYKDKTLLSAKEEIKELKTLVTDFNESIERAKRQFKPSHKRKLDYNKMIKAATNSKEEYQIVKDWVFGILQVDKWEDTSTEDSKKIIETITTVSSLLKIKKIQQLSMFEEE